MDQHQHQPSSDKDFGITAVFLIILVAALLMMRYDNTSLLSRMLQGNTQMEHSVADPIPPASPL